MKDEPESPRTTDVVVVANETRHISEFEGAVMVAPDGMTYRIANGRWEKVQDQEQPVKEWRAREAAAFALYPIMQREDMDDLARASAGELAQTAIDTYLRVLAEPLPEGWKKYV